MAKKTKKKPPTDERAADPPHSEIAADLIAFAGKLRTTVTEALKFSEEEVAKRLGWDATKNAETHFVNRAKKTSKEMQSRGEEFSALEARCTNADPCRAVVDDLVGGGLPRAIEIVATDLAGIANRARRPLSDHDRDKLFDELQGLRGLCETLIEVAAWIEDEASTLRGEPAPGQRRVPAVPPEPSLPPEIAAAVLQAEEQSRGFIDRVEELVADLERGSNESTLAWLKRLGSSVTQIDASSKKVVQRLKHFTDKAREAAERVGHARVLKFLDKCERVHKRVAARRAISTSLVKTSIARLLSRLSLTDQGDHAAAEICVMLGNLSQRIAAHQRALERQADSVTNERRANAVTADELPAWDEIQRCGDRGDDGPSNLAMLLMAFVDYSGKTPDFEPWTKKQLRERLDRLFLQRNGRRFSDTWIYQWVKKARDLKIVYRHDPPKGRSRRVGDTFELCRAAIRKYRRYLVRPQFGRRASGR